MQKICISLRLAAAAFLLAAASVVPIVGWSQSPNDESLTAEPPTGLSDTADASPSALVVPSDAEASAVESGVVDRQTDSQLRFSFNGARWREVIEWLAEQGDLALHVNELPTGTFTYSDSTYFTLDEAINRLNLFMIPEGHAAVRRGNLLTVITLGDPRSLQQLETLARQVKTDELNEVSDHEVVRCFLPLGDLPSGEVLGELQTLSLMTTPTVLPRSKQLIVIDTADKLRQIVDVISKMDEPEEEDSAVRRFNLQHTDADTVLMVAGTHLGIPEFDTSGLDISITSDPTGKRLFAIGNPEKVELLGKLIAEIDVADEEPTTTEPGRLVSHPVKGDDLQSVYDVLQTLFADQPIRLSMQENSNSIVALAPADIQEQISETIEELAAPTLEFAVVELNGVDPYFAVALIDELFSGEEVDTSDRRRSRWDWWRDDEEESESSKQAPKVDADVENGRLFVRGTSDDIRQIEQLVQRLSPRTSTANSRETSRVIPIDGPYSEEVLRAAERQWDYANPVLIPWQRTKKDEQVIERVLNEDEDPDTIGTNVTASNSQSEKIDETYREADFGRGAILTALADDTSSDVAPPIRTQVLPEGIFLQSEDVEALDEFEARLRELASRATREVSPPVIYYLKYVTANDAVSMLADLLDGGFSLTETSGSGLVNGTSTDSSSAYFGSLMFERDGMKTITAGTATIVSDARLNRLIVQGTSADMAIIDRYMKIIDQESSLTQIETAGRTHVVELVHCQAEEVSEAIKAAFPNRLIEEGNRTAGRGADPRQRDQGRDDRRDDRGDDERGQGRPQEKPTRGQLSKMAVAVHEPSNSLIVTAPDDLFEQVKLVIDEIDQKSEQTVAVVPTGPGVSLEAIMQALGEEVPDNRDRRSDFRRRDEDRRRER